MLPILRQVSASTQEPLVLWDGASKPEGRQGRRRNCLKWWSNGLRDKNLSRRVLRRRPRRVRPSGDEFESEAESGEERVVKEMHESIWRRQG